jgi:hypothetical protein
MTEYSVKVAALSRTSAALEVSLFSSRKTGVELQIMLKDVTEQRRESRPRRISDRKTIHNQVDCSIPRCYVQEKGEKLEKRNKSSRSIKAVGPDNRKQNE